ASVWYRRVDVSMVRLLPAVLPLRLAALAEPLGVGLHCIARAGGVRGQRVLVAGAGAIGLLTAGAAVALGAKSVTSTDVLDEPLQRARALGVNSVVNVAEESLATESFDVVLECSGVPAAINAALVAARRAGTYVQVGMVPNESRGLNLAPMISKELTVHGSFRFNTEIDDAVRMLSDYP